MEVPFPAGGFPVSPSSPPRRPGARAWPWVVLLVAGGVLIARTVWPRVFPLGLRDHGAAPRAVTARGDLAQDEKSTIELFERSSPSVVYITTLVVRRDPLGLGLAEVPQGTGSGFIWDEKGHVVTNFHVIQGARSAEVTLADHTTWKASLVGAEPDKDLAVLKIEAPRDKMRPIPIGSAHDLKVGQKVFAIGNPFGLDQTLTTGVISGLDREIQTATRRSIQGVIQTDAAINPGNSGGPLLDSAGRLIGVNTAIYSPSGAYAGVGFAVPVDTINRIVPQIIQHGRVVRPGLGITVDAQDRFSRRLAGVLVIDVAKDSAAEKAGIRPTRPDAGGRPRFGDVITAIDRKPVKKADDLYRILDQRKVGDFVTVTVKREEKAVDLEVKLQALP